MSVITLKNSLYIAAYDIERAVLFSAITTSFLPVSPILAFKPRMIKFVNATDSSIQISLDGTNVHDFFPPSFTTSYDLKMDQMTFAKGTQFYIRSDPLGMAPTKNAFHIIILYAQGE